MILAFFHMDGISSLATKMLKSSVRYSRPLGAKVFEVKHGQAIRAYFCGV
jgi:hypothetical protein